MNPLQMAQQIKAELQSVTWSGGDQEVVFGSQSVFIGTGPLSGEQDYSPSFPFAIVTIDGGTPDEEDPDILEQNFTILVAAESAGDPLGEQAIAGGPRVNIGSSAGAGVAEVAERARSVIQDLTGIDGAHVVLSSTGIAAITTMDQGLPVAIEEITVTAWCFSQPWFAEPQHLAFDDDETWTWSGAHCSSRYDFIQYRLMYRTGSTPGETPSDMDGTVYTGTSTTATHDPTAGRVYSIFADYGTRTVDDDTPENSSTGDLVGTYVAT